MATHTKILVGEPIDNDDESDNHLAKEINDLISSAASYTITATKFGSRIAVIITYIDA